MAKIVQVIVDLKDKPLDDPHIFKSGFSTKQEAEQWLDDYLTATFAFHEYDEEQGYWWGRQNDSKAIARFTVEL